MGGIWRARSFRTTRSQSSECCTTPVRLMLSRSTPPFFTSLSWQLRQYLFTTVTTCSAGREDERLNGCGAAEELQVTTNIASQRRTETPQRADSARQKPMAIRFSTAVNGI